MLSCMCEGRFHKQVFPWQGVGRTEPIVFADRQPKGEPMTPEDLDNALKSLARTFVREVEQQEVPLRVNQELAVDIIRTKKYQHRDEVSLILEARTYIKGRLPVRDRATAVAILLQRDAVLIESPERGHHESGTF